MVNIQWNVFNMVTIWLMVIVLFVAVGLGKSLLGNMSGAAQ